MNANTAFPTYTVAHEFIVEHMNGKRGTIRRAGLMTKLMEIQARRIFSMRHDIRSIDIFRIDNEGGKNRVVIIHKGNQERAAKPVAPAQAAPRARAFNVSWRKVGGLTFVRLGRLSLSFCLTKKAI